MKEHEEQELSLKANTQEQKKEQELSANPDSADAASITTNDLPFPSVSINDSPHPMVVLKCNTCGEDFKMEEYWYNLWMEKKEINRKYRGIRCKYCGSWDSIEKMEVIVG